ncbi:MAG: ParB/RepB/Spo0J family partition protein [Bacillota bacterium]|nr:ParB/RepB/Spo0J family partition protein [Bacillota bacterium]MDW7684285.1 ParB/RepB/Spo0J family partition protein [Bacillota bacterium]
MSKKRLGRGLQALIPEIEDTPLSDAVEIVTEDIRTNPYQPRKHFNEEKLAELAQSVERHGILQPLIVRPAGDGFELVAGERRLRAAKMVGLERVPVVVRPLTDREMSEIALIENLQREDLNPLEEADAYRRLMDEFGYTQEQLAERVGKSRSAVANTLRLTSLHPDVRLEVAAGRLSEGHARAILALPLEKQPAAAAKAVELGLSVRETERLASQAEKNPERKGKERIPAKDGYITDIEDRLREICGTAVHVRTSAKGTGKLEIHFYDMEELERLCEILF